VDDARANSIHTPGTDGADPRRRLPAVGTVCAHPAARALAAEFGASLVTRTVRGLLAEERRRLAIDGPPPPTLEAIIDEVGRRLADGARESLVGVVNATGVVIHTNLGRAPLAEEAVAAMAAAAHYANLEFDLKGGGRASRHDHLDRLIAELTGAESGLAVNNGAGAVLLALAALSAGSPVIVSRGELIEIGGGFRVPDIVAQSGARLVEVGATNRTHIADYEHAARQYPEARTILRTHPSNFRITGFTSAPAVEDLAAFARARGMMLIEDLGGGALVDLEPHGISGEPMVQDRVRAGVDLVVFSGDKLLGGPQAGIVAGRRELVDRLARHPLARALRLDKVSLAALAATFRLYRPPGDPIARVPVLRMLTQSASALDGRAEQLLAMLVGLGGLEAAIIDTESFAGGGAMPMHALPSRAVALRAERLRTEDLARRLRTGVTPVIGRSERNRLLLDMRTVADQELPVVARSIIAAVGAPD
jgi:L-seryl-tRNA(Ser) seleniumtransferase